MDELASKVEQVEGLIGDCMTAAGFEYVPVDFARVKEGMDADKSAPGLSDEEFIAQYGFGITTQYDHPGRELGLGEQNVAIYEAFPPQEKVAYDHALLGEDREATFAQSVEAEDFSKTGGCTRQAVEQVVHAAGADAGLHQPGRRGDHEDPRVVEATGKWSDCMRQKGYDYANPDDVEQDLHDRLDALTARRRPPDADRLGRRRADRAPGRGAGAGAHLDPVRGGVHGAGDLQGGGGGLRRPRVMTPSSG